MSVKPFVLAQFRIPNSEFRIEPINPNLKFSHKKTAIREMRTAATEIYESSSA